MMMKVINKIFFSMIIFYLTGCLGLSNQPPDEFHIQWFKPNVSREETKKAIEECGFQNIYGYSGFYLINEDAKRENCMFKRGFKYKNASGVCSMIHADELKEFPDCKGFVKSK
jgi:hypothetical protein